LYAVVLSAWEAARVRLVAGETWLGVEAAAVRALCTGLVRLGLVDDDVDTLIHEQAYRRFYAHEIGHWLGLDVHDPGALYVGGASRRFVPGMVVALEPGLYVQPDDEEAPEAFRGIGVRIEDDFVITDGAPELLTTAPRTVAEIEAVRGVRGTRS
jgi:Xaa-Pro aminopeptidase